MLGSSMFFLTPRHCHYLKRSNKIYDGQSQMSHILACVRAWQHAPLKMASVAKDQNRHKAASSRPRTSQSFRNSKGVKRWQTFAKFWISPSPVFAGENFTWERGGHCISHYFFLFFPLSFLFLLPPLLPSAPSFKKKTLNNISLFLSLSWYQAKGNLNSFDVRSTDTHTNTHLYMQCFILTTSSEKHPCRRRKHRSTYIPTIPTYVRKWVLSCFHHHHQHGMWMWG